MDGQTMIKMCLSKFFVLPWSQQLLSSINRRTRTKQSTEQLDKPIGLLLHVCCSTHARKCRIQIFGGWLKL